MTTPDLAFRYIGDPMCSWCWGFAPVLEQLRDTFALPVEVAVGGLRPGPAAEELDDRMRDFLAHHWEQVEATSSQPFDHAGLHKPEGWKYDTEPGCVAVVTMRALAPADTLRFMARLKRAFYAENVDITDTTVYPALLEGFGVDPADFMARFRSDDMKKVAWQDFAAARKLGVNGFPTLLLREGETFTLATAGYMPAERLVPGLQRWFEQRHPAVLQGAACDVDGC